MECQAAGCVFKKVWRTKHLFFINRNVAITPSWESTSVQTLINAVQENHGISFLSLKHVLAIHSNDIVILDMEGFSAERFVNVCYHKDKQLTPLTHDFIQHY